MIRITVCCAAILGLGLTMTACAQHGTAQANCFNFRDRPVQTETTTATFSTMGTEAAHRDSPCEFVMLGAGS